jgi:hypothetical protein
VLTTDLLTSPSDSLPVFPLLKEVVIIASDVSTCFVSST